MKPWLHVPPTSAPTENAVPGTDKKPARGSMPTHAYLEAETRTTQLMVIPDR